MAAATVEIDGSPVHGKTSGLISPVPGDITDLGELFLGVGPELALRTTRKAP